MTICSARHQIIRLLRSSAVISLILLAVNVNAQAAAATGSHTVTPADAMCDGVSIIADCYGTDTLTSGGYFTAQPDTADRPENPSHLDGNPVNDLLTAAIVAIPIAASLLYYAIYHRGSGRWYR